MKITLISPYSSLASLGVRSISASLKKAGHAVTMLFLTSSPFPDSLIPGNCWIALPSCAGIRG